MVSEKQATPGSWKGFSTVFSGLFGGLPRTYWVVWSGVLISRAGTMVVPFLALFLSSERDMSVAMAGTVVAVLGLGGACSQVVGGVLTDVWGRRVAFAIGPVATGASLLTLGYVQGTFATLAAAFLAGMCLQLYQPAAGAIVADVVDKERRSRAYGLLYWAVNIGFSAAAVLGGALAQRDFTLLFWVDAVVCVMFGLMIWWRLPPDEPRNADRPVPSGGYRDVLRDRVMVCYVLLLLVHGSVQFQMHSTLPLVMTGQGLTPADYGLAIAVNGVLVVLSQPLLSRWLEKLDRSTVLCAGVLLMGTGFGLGAFASTLVGYALTVVVWTIGEVVVAVVVWAITADLAPDQLRGRYNGLFGASYALAAVIAPFWGTQVYAHAGATVLWASCFGLCALAATGQWILGYAIRTRAAREDEDSVPDSAGG